MHYCKMNLQETNQIWDIEANYYIENEPRNRKKWISANPAMELNKELFEEDPNDI